MAFSVVLALNQKINLTQRGRACGGFGFRLKAYFVRLIIAYPLVRAIYVCAIVFAGVHVISSFSPSVKLLPALNFHLLNKFQEILLELNEAKLQSAMVFVDPTFKERNTLAALSLETLDKMAEITG